MTLINPNTSRREFLRRSSALTAAGVSGVATPIALNLAAMGEAAAHNATDYKAIVCIFLFGGNDYANTVTPFDAANYSEYLKIRGATLSHSKASLAATTLNPLPASATIGDTELAGRQYALAPNLSSLMPLFNDQKLAVLLNAGTLVEPTTKAQYAEKSVLLPQKLLSHNDQQSYWQSSGSEGTKTGWGGRIGDIFASGNGNSIFTGISVTGNAVFLSGKTTAQYRVDTSGPIALKAVHSSPLARSTSANPMRTLISHQSTQGLEGEHSKAMARALQANDQLSTALAANPSRATLFDTGDSLASQLKMVSQIIDARSTLGTRRQVFFVSLDGFDTHDRLTLDHPALMSKVADAMAKFNESMIELGTQNLVTSFTASDFGRTLTGNNDGTDHGWGSHHLIMGGAVKGKRFYGAPPAVASNGPDDIGQGRLVPTTSVDQLGATLATWFGVSPTQILDVMPNLKNFTTKTVGFL